MVEFADGNVKDEAARARIASADETASVSGLMCSGSKPWPSMTASQLSFEKVSSS